jgi:hypothetical protein
MKLSESILFFIREDKNSSYKDFLKGKYLDWAIASEEAILKAESDKLIYNVDFNEAKSRLKSALRSGGESAVEAVANQHKLSPDAKRELLSTFGFFIFDDFKKLDKESKDSGNPLVQEVRMKFLLPLKSMYDRLLELKPFIVKGAKPRANAKPVYVPPYSSFKALAEVKKVYDQIIDKMHDDIVKSIVEIDMKRADGLSKSLPSISVREFGKLVDYELLGRHFVKSGSGISDYKLKEDRVRKQVVAKYAEEAAKGIEDQFVSKNLAKVTSLVGEKGNLSEAKSLGVDTRSGVLSGEIRFDFADGSGFTIRNQLVSVWAYDREPYHRFPSTFHDIISKDGTKQKMKSEEWMNTVWAKQT